MPLAAYKLIHTKPRSATMNISKLIERVLNILTAPQTEWPAIAGEATTVPDLYKSYIAIIAVIPAVADFIKGSLIGYGAFGFAVRTPLFSGLVLLAVSYLLWLAMVYVLALIIDALAPTFGGQKNQIQALKTVAYSLAAGWIASIGQLVPWLGLPIILAGSAYSIYLLSLGLPVTMKCPPEKAVGYTAVSVICAILLSAVIIGVGSGFTYTRTGLPLGGAGAGDTATAFDQNTWLGKMEAAGKQMEAAQKSGNADAQGKAAGAMVSAALGGGDQVEALAPDQLKPFVPETLDGLKRADFSAQRNSAMGMQISQAQATYSDGAGRSLHLDISDMGSMKGLASLAGWAGVGNERVTDHGYDKFYKQGGRLVHEQWDNQSGSGEFGVVVGERFSVKVSGSAASIDTLKTAVAGLNLAGLEALKDQGVKKD